MVGWIEIGPLLAVFVAVSIVAYLGVAWIIGRDRLVARRLGDLSRADRPVVERPVAPGRRSLSGGELGKRLLPKFSGWLQLDSEAERVRLHRRFVRAGILHPAAPSVYLGARILLGVGLLLMGLAVGLCGVVSVSTGLLLGVVAGGSGMFVPSFCLDWMKSRRQRTLRNSLPDFIDLIVTCVEGGLSFDAALQRVCDELSTAHPVLAGEMGVVRREIELGKTPHAALRNFADRCDLAVVRSLATLVEHAQRFGASMADSLRAHADTLRTQREQRAEEMAQQATVKILFPTLMFIFPATLIVLAGPAAIEIQQKFAAPKTEISAEESLPALTR